MQSPSFEMLLQALPQACVLLDRQLVVLDANPAYLELTGCRLESLRARPLGASFAGDGAWSTLEGKLRASAARVWREGRPDTLSDEPYAVAEAEGAPVSRRFRITQAPLVGADGQVVALLQSLDEIAAEDALLLQRVQRLDTQLQARTDELQQQMARCQALEARLDEARRLEALGRLTGGIAHAFNNALQVIGGNLQLVRRSLGSDPVVGRRLDAAIASSERSGRLASQLLGHAGQSASPSVDAPLAERLSLLLELLNAALAGRPQLRLQLQPGLWTVRGRDGRVESLLLQLILAAGEALEGRGRIGLEARNAPALEAGGPDRVLVELWLDGGGDVRSPRWAECLASVRRQLADAEGVVECPATGECLVRIGLPRGETARPAPADTSPAAAPVASRRILFVEDDPTLRMLTAEVMSELGHQVVLGSSAEEALTLLAGEPFDLLFTDVGLPGMSGLELAREVRRRYPGLEVVIASGYAVDVGSERLDGVQCMLKPYDLERIRSLLAGPAAGH